MTDAIILDMDESRELKWTFGAIKNFEKRGREILKRLDLKNERGQAVANIPTHAGYLLANFLKISDILEAAVAAATRLSGMEGKKGEPSEASTAIESYLQNGGDLESLQKAVYKAYLVANDPSSIVEWNENIVREEETKRINKEKTVARMEIARLELADDLKKIENMKKISGGQSTGSDT
ncbi:hypothetical protein M0R72_19095 [Candidatus Pacearchaeota archaeon]|jgi:hypothetical protein|nr:hypothetical protein [Candidatus Pacearchaeota archaeon]